MGLIDWAKKKLKQAGDFIGGLIGAGRQLAGNVVNAAKQLPGKIAGAAQGLKGAAQRAFQQAPPIPLLGVGSPLGASAIVNKLAQNEDVQRTAGNVFTGVSQVLNRVNPINLPQRVGEVAQMTEKIPIVGDVTKQFGDLAQSGTAPVRAVGQLLQGDVAGANREVMESPLLRKQLQAKQEGKGPVQQFTPAVGLGAEVGTTLAPFPALKGGSLLARAGKGALAGGVAGGGFEAGRQVYEQEPFNPQNIGVAAGIGAGTVGAMPFLGRGVSVAGQKLKSFMSPTDNIRVVPKGPPVTITQSGAPELQGIPKNQAKEAVAQIRDRGSVNIEPQNIITETVPSKIQSVRGAQPTVQTRPGIKIVPSEALPNTKLFGLSAEAKKAPTFEDFKSDYLTQIKHGRYYHITDNPNFKIDPNRGPRDMSSMGTGKERKGALMVTSDLERWLEEYPNRKYVAVIDTSSVPRQDFQQVDRGFGNEFFVNKPSQAKTTKVVTVEQALKEDAQYRATLPKNEVELRQLYDQVNSAPQPQTAKIAGGGGLPVETPQTKFTPESNADFAATQAQKAQDDMVRAADEVAGVRSREYGRSQALRANEDVPATVKEGLGQKYEQRQSAVATQDAYGSLKNDPKAETDFVTAIDDAVAKKDVSDPTISDKIVALTQHYVDRGDDASLKAAAELTRKTQDLYAKAGQFNQAAANFDRLGTAGQLRYAEREASNAGVELSPEFRKYLVQKSEELAKMPEGESKDLARFMLQNDIAKQLPQRFRDKVVTFWKTGLLTNPTTTAGNIMGNTGSAIGEKVSDLFATAMDVPLSAVTGKRSKAFSLKGGLEGTSEGFQKTWKYLKTGFDERRLPSKYDAPKIINNGNNPLGKTLDFYENGVFRLMGAADMPFYYMRKANSLYEQGIVAIRNGTIKRSQLNEFVKNPTAFEGGEQALKNATSDASYAVFQNDTTLGKWAQDLANRAPALGEFIAPFRRTPSSIAMRLVDYSPVGAGRTIVSAAKSATKEKGLTQQAQRELVQGLGRAGTGTALMAAGAVLADKGVMTLGYPSDDQAEQRLWELEGKQPYSIKVNGKWRSLNYASPWGQLLATGGFFQKGYKDTGSYWEGALQAAAGAGKTLADMSFLRGVAAPLNAIQNPKIFAERYAEQTAGSIVPGIVRNLATGLDPVKRDVEGVGEAFMSSIPGLRERLNPQLNVFGEPIPAPRGLAEQMLDPTRPSNVLNEPLAARLRETTGSEKGLYVPDRIDAKNPGKIGGLDVDLNRQQLLELQSQSGRLFRRQLEQAVSTPGYDSLTPELKKKVIEAASGDARAIARVMASGSFGIGSFNRAFTDLDTSQKMLFMGRQPNYVEKVTENEQKSIFKEQNQPLLTPELEGVMMGYYDLPERSQARRDYIAAHPELKDYWDKNKAYVAAFTATFGEDPKGNKAKSGFGGYRRGGRRGYRRGGGRKGGSIKIANPKLKTKVGKIRTPSQKRKKQNTVKIVATKKAKSTVGRPRRAPIKYRRTTIKIKKA